VIGLRIDELTCPICNAPASFMAKHPEAHLYRCKVCSHPFSDPGSVDEERYEGEYFASHHKRWFDHPNTPLFDRIADALPHGASVLDVGCGRGDFLRYLRSIRPDLILAGVDLSENQAAEGINFYRGDFLATNFGRKFDAVVSLAVIEHISNIQAFAHRIRDLTAPGGNVVVMTLNESSILYALAKAGKNVGVPLAFNRLYSRHHLHHFTRRSLRILLERSGLHVKLEFTHNAPLTAIDIPVKAQALDTILRAAMWSVCKAGDWTGTAYLQTIICDKPTICTD